jgi:hypothetical protein
MKRFSVFGLVLFVLAMAALAIAGPFIVADPQTDATKYRMRLSADNGTTWGSWVEGNPVSNALKFDIAGTPKGTYLGEAQAGGNIELTDSATGQVSTVWQWSASAPFLLKVRAGQKTANIKVTE